MTAQLRRPDDRVLVLAPTGRDASNTLGFLQKAGLNAAICRDVGDLLAQIDAGVGAVLLTEEALALDVGNRIGAWLSTQPAWSDLPFVFLAHGGTDSPAGLRAMRQLGNVVLLERPVRVSTLVTAVRTALRGRLRQIQISELLEQLHDADRRKDEFLAMLAHELRNPLAPMRSAADILLAVGNNPRRLSEVADILGRQVGILARLVDDLLDISRVTRGKIQLTRERVALATLIARAVETSQPLIEENRQRLSVTIPEQPVYLDCDPTRIVQVLSNLLNNATKYTPSHGRIWLSAQVEDDDVVIRVRDDGIGIAPEMLSRIFDLFTQVDSSLDRARGGLGVGLTLVRSIVELHRGTVHAHSAGPGQGAEFTARLPRANSMVVAVPETAPTMAPRSPCRVLLVDDNRDAVASLGLLLQQSGHELRTAGNGNSALELAESFDPQVIILDIGLPGMNGWEVARRIRAGKRPTTPLLLALTGYGHEQDRQRARDAGFDHYLIKPADFATLENLIANFRQRHATH